MYIRGGLNNLLDIDKLHKLHNMPMNNGNRIELPSLKWTLFAIFTVVIVSVAVGIYIIFYVPKITNNVILAYFGGLFFAAIIIYKILMLSSEQYLMFHGVKVPKREKSSSWLPIYRKTGTKSDADDDELY